jgi:hypothetical protein
MKLGRYDWSPLNQIVTTKRETDLMEHAANTQIKGEVSTQLKPTTPLDTSPASIEKLTSRSSMQKSMSDLKTLIRH